MIYRHPNEPVEYDLDQLTKDNDTTLNKQYAIDPNWKPSPDPCRTCPNRPTANDPFKVCLCTLGLPTVTC